MGLFDRILNESCNKEIDEMFDIEADKLFVGDICYALKDDIYRSVWGDKLGYEDGLIRINGKDGEICAVVGGTAYGDGSYKGTDGTEFGVDAGVIGVTSSKYFDKEVDSELGKIVEVPGGKARVHFVDNYGDFDIEIRDIEGNVLYHVEIFTGENEEEEDCCPYCGAGSDWYDGYSCGKCGYGEEEEEDDYEEEDDL